ncbi:type II secretion system F family protein [Oceanirhabdus sp. W0125-5]|uniref:type II secretion system F family protein n=1 Tax=Oceanirhabdus sp. W0125-5 TaxID=2999116 RepID=UPI0022F34270|nr:type II secretion system F family protein [Oceanirhabdus sp. W0125-5]WBW95954.1 type II secretion system F family protein [Oceanirhabdus sp. W0125-5]
MEIIICSMVLILVLVITLPGELFKKKSIYNYVMNKEKETVQLNFDNKTVHKFIGIVRKITKYIPESFITKNQDKIGDKIITAGLKNIITVEEFIGAKFLLMSTTGLIFTILTIGEWTGLNLLMIISASLMAYFVPEQWITSKGRNRQNNIQKEVPSVLSTLAIITDAGLNLIPALDETIKQHNGEFSKELRSTLEEIHIGVPQKEAFIKLSQRCSVDEVNYFVSALIQGLEKGNSGITQIIRNQAKESWDKRKYKAKELAEKASMKLFMPLLLLVFPAFIIFLIVPMIFSVLRMF